MRAVAAMAALALAGCGGSGETATAPAAGKTTTTASGSGEDAVRAVVAGFHSAYARRDTGVCRFISARARAEILQEIQTRRPRLFGKRCGNAFVVFYGSLPRGQQPAAARQARPAEVSVSGDTATVRFANGPRWRLVRGASGWQIDDFPIVPRR